MRYIAIIFNIWQTFAIYSNIVASQANEEQEATNIPTRPNILEDIMKQSRLIEPSMKNLVVPLLDNDTFKDVAANSLAVLQQHTVIILNMFREKAKVLTNQFIDSLFLVEPIKQKISKEEFKIWLDQLLANVKACTDSDGLFSIQEALKNSKIFHDAFAKSEKDENSDNQSLENQEGDNEKMSSTNQFANILSTIERIAEAYEIGMNAIAERTLEFIQELGLFNGEHGNLQFDQMVQLFPGLSTNDSTDRRLSPSQHQQPSLLYNDNVIQEINKFETDIDREKDKVIREVRALLGFYQLKYDQVIVKKAIQRVGLENIKEGTEVPSKLLTQQESHVIELLLVKHQQVEQIIAKYKNRADEIYNGLKNSIDAVTLKSFKQRLNKYISDDLFKDNTWFASENAAVNRRLSVSQGDSAPYNVGYESNAYDANVYNTVSNQKDIIHRNIEGKLKIEIPTPLQMSVSDAFPDSATLASVATIALRNFQARIESLYSMLPMEFLTKNNLSHVLNNSAIMDVLRYANSNVAKRWEDLPLNQAVIQNLKSDGSIMPFDAFVRKLEELNRILQQSIDEAMRYTVSQLSRLGANLSSSDLKKLDKMMHEIASQYLFTPLHTKQIQSRRLEADEGDDLLLIELIRSIMDIIQDYEKAIGELEEKLVENADISVAIYEYFKTHDPEYLKHIKTQNYVDISTLKGERGLAAEDALQSIMQIYRSHLKALRAEILATVEENKWIIDTIGWERIELLQEKLEIMLNELTPAEALHK